MTAPVVLIVGAGDYIGAAIARRFARGGYTVCMGRRNGDKLGPLVEEIRAEGGIAHGFTLDARDEDNVTEVFRQVEDAHGPIEVMIFNVGGNVRFPILETTSRVFRKVWEMACFAGFLSGREAARYMVPRGRGCILFTGATASVKGSAGFAAFAAGKHGLRALAQSMARELGRKNIHVAHLVIDAGVDTAFVRERIAQAGSDPGSLPPDTLMRPESVAETYWMLAHQPRDAWTFELDLRPYGETW
ncbi:SDR family oxidoreductase [Jhaorihella thermophila]|uniref:Short-chain dehydrogenase n=1 Tax=Jhaorihella thermophila TaxID=488547 RepID=A0A1H5SFG5_9RHOB|nr:SDR family oxidoreductase [Jhaorihella thermophila]SEF49170.1 hypothetical protein SAMN05421751_101492 [Jhaorihella thermophila]